MEQDADSFLNKTRKLLLKKNVLYAVAAANIFGTLFGFYYYLPQISENSPLLWIFIMDSPLSTLFITGSIIFHLKGDKVKLLDYMAFIGNFKYGLWTVFVLFHYFESFLQLRGGLMFSFLVISHILMFFQSFLVLGYTEFDLKLFSAAAVFFVVNDILDYGLGIHSSLPEVNGFLSPVAAVAFSLTALSVFSLYFFKKKRNML